MRAYAVALALLLPLALASCSSEDATPSAASPEPSASASPSSTAPAFNPCDGLTAGQVSRALGSAVTEETGTADNPRCAFLPDRRKDPTLNVTYLEFDGDFEEAFASMGEPDDGQVSRLELPKAKAARLVVDVRRKAVLVTGFVQVGGLIETVNAVALAPYDADAVVGGTRTVMAALARSAPTG